MQARDDIRSKKKEPAAMICVQKIREIFLLSRSRNEREKKLMGLSVWTALNRDVWDDQGIGEDFHPQGSDGFGILTCWKEMQDRTILDPIEDRAVESSPMRKKRGVWLTMPRTTDTFSAALTSREKTQMAPWEPGRQVVSSIIFLAR